MNQKYLIVEIFASNRLTDAVAKTDLCKLVTVFFYDDVMGGEDLSARFIMLSNTKTRTIDGVPIQQKSFITIMELDHCTEDAYFRVGLDVGDEVVEEISIEPTRMEFQDLMYEMKFKDILDESNIDDLPFCIFEEDNTQYIETRLNELLELDVGGLSIKNTFLLTKREVPCGTAIH